MVGKLYVMNKKYVYLLLVFIILITSQAILVLAERPSWAQEGVWLRYETELRASYGGYTITAHVRYKSTLVEVTDQYGRFQGEIESLDVQVNPANDQLRSQVEQNLRNNLREVTIYWDECGRDYCPPNQLPADGVIQREDGRYVYDRNTGLLKEFNGNIQGVTVTLRMIDSNLGGGFGGIGGGGSWWIIIVIVIVVVIVVGVLVAILKARRSTTSHPVMPPPPPPHLLLNSEYIGEI